MPTKRIENSKPTKGKQADRVIARLDMDALAESLADKLGEQDGGISQCGSYRHDTL